MTRVHFGLYRLYAMVCTGAVGAVALIQRDWFLGVVAVAWLSSLVVWGIERAGRRRADKAQGSISYYRLTTRQGS